jgi:hypothetical protein
LAALRPEAEGNGGWLRARMRAGFPLAQVERPIWTFEASLIYVTKHSKTGPRKPWSDSATNQIHSLIEGDKYATLADFLLVNGALRVVW